MERGRDRGPADKSPPASPRPVVIAGIPCDGYSVARFRDGNGPPPLRDRTHPLGLDRTGLREKSRPEANVDLVRDLVRSNTLTVRGMTLCAHVFESGGEVIIENPVDYASDKRLRSIKLLAGQARHCPIWNTPAVKAFLPAACRGDDSNPQNIVEFDQCACNTSDSRYKKPTALAATVGIATYVIARFSGKFCDCGVRPHAKVAVGRDSNGHLNSTAAAAYPDRMNRGLADCVYSYLLARSKLPGLSALLGQGRGFNRSECKTRRSGTLVAFWAEIDSPAMRLAQSCIAGALDSYLTRSSNRTDPAPMPATAPSALPPFAPEAASGLPAAKRAKEGGEQPQQGPTPQPQCARPAACR